MLGIRIVDKSCTMLFIEPVENQRLLVAYLAMRRDGALEVSSSPHLEALTRPVTYLQVADRALITVKLLCNGIRTPLENPKLCALDRSAVSSFMRAQNSYYTEVCITRGCSGHTVTFFWDTQFYKAFRDKISQSSGT